MKDLVIFGAGGHAREARALVEAINADRHEWALQGFLDENPQRHGQAMGGYPVLGGARWLADHPKTAVVIAIGNSSARAAVMKRLSARLCPAFVTLVHPQAVVGRQVRIGEGSMIAAGCIVTTDVSIGAHVILNTGVTLSHDSVLSDFVTVAPGVHIAGAVTIGEGCEIGIGASIAQGHGIGHWSVLGAGAVVTTDLPSNATAVGVPAKVIKEREEGWHLATWGPAGVGGRILQ